VGLKGPNLIRSIILIINGYIDEKLKLMKEIIKITIKIKHNKVYTMLSSKGDFF